jgi:mRNA interferase RelE/StbE
MRRWPRRAPTSLGIRSRSISAGRELRPAAVRALKRLDPPVRRRIQGAIALLAEDPRPPAARALRGRPGLRVRVGDYRIVYTVADDVLLIVVVTVGHRRDVYDR